MATIKERANEWLRDAHATEAQAATMLRGTASRNDDYPEFSQRLMQQAEICDRNAQSIDQCLNERGSSPSLIKDTTGKLTALGQSLSGTIVGDELMKAALATTTFARMQSASARILVAAAEQEGDTTTARVCEEMANSSERFAREIDDMLPRLTVEYLSRETNGDAGDSNDMSSQGIGQTGGSTATSQTFRTPDTFD